MRRRARARHPPLLTAGIALAALFGVGTAGYMTISGLGFTDALYVTVITLHPELVIVARAEDDRSERKLLHAGATRVVSPYATAWRTRSSGRRCST
jgi:hypothetical protein